MNGKLRLYVNGKLVDEEGGVGLLYSHGNDAGIGGINAGTIFHDEIADGTLLTDSYFFNGTIDEVAQYNLVLNAEQVASHFELGSTGADNEEAPAISISRNADGTVTVTFDGTLQSAPTVNGPWTDVPGESPINLSPEQAQQFGRAVRK